MGCKPAGIGAGGWVHIVADCDEREESGPEIGEGAISGGGRGVSKLYVRLQSMFDSRLRVRWRKSPNTTSSTGTAMSATERLAAETPHPPPMTNGPRRVLSTAPVGGKASEAVLPSLPPATTGSPASVVVEEVPLGRFLSGTVPASTVVLVT